MASPRTGRVTMNDAQRRIIEDAVRRLWKTINTIDGKFCGCGECSQCEAEIDAAVNGIVPLFSLIPPPVCTGTGYLGVGIASTSVTMPACGICGQQMWGSNGGYMPTHGYIPVRGIPEFKNRDSLTDDPSLR